MSLSKGIKIKIVKIVAFTALSGILALFFYLLVRHDVDLSTRTPRSEKDNWVAAVMEFYNEAAEKVEHEITVSGARRVVLHTEENRSRFLASSPCNEGLASILMERFKARSVQPAEIFFQRQPIPAGSFSQLLSNSWGWIWRRFHQPRKSALVNQDSGSGIGWFRMHPEGDIEGPFESFPPGPALHLAIAVNKIDLDVKSKRFTAEFELVGGRDDVGDTRSTKSSLLRKSCNGATTQVRWFIREDYSGWLAFLNLFAFLYVALLLFQERSMHTVKLTVRVALACALLGQAYPLVLLVLSPMERDRVNFHEQSHLLYLVDSNSEIWFTPTETHERKVGPLYLARRIEEFLRENVIKEQSSRTLSFWQWLISDSFLKAVYRPKKYDLNSPAVLDVYTFSGLEERAWQHIPGGVRSILEKGPSTPQTAGLTYQEPRLISQFGDQDFRELLESGRKDENFVLLLTSASAPYLEEVNKFLESTRSADRGTSLPAYVFTVLVPSLPTTGADSFFDYEDGKIALISLISNSIIILNRPGLERSIPFNDQDLFGLYGRPELNALLRVQVGWTSPGIAANVLSLQHPLYNIEGLSYSNRSNWDAPRDMDVLRTKHLMVEQERANEAAVEIGQKLDIIYKEKTQGKQKRSIHVMGQAILMMSVIVSMSFLLGCYAFVQQCSNETYLDCYMSYNYWARFKAFRPLHYLSFLMTGLFVLLIFLGLTYRSEDPEIFTAFGDPERALIAGLLCCLSWVAAPLVCFNVWGWGIVGSGTRLPNAAAKSRKGMDRLKTAPCWAFVSTSTIAVALALLCWLYTPEDTAESRLFKFSLTIIIFTMTIFALLLKSRRLKATAINGPVEWWRLPWWSFLVKSLLITGIVLLVRGAFPASLGMGDGLIAQLTSLLSYDRFVLIIAATFSFLALCMALTQQKRHFQFVTAAGLVITILPFFFS